LTTKALPRFKTLIRNFTLIPSKGGCFEVIVGGQKLYSKLKTGKFPDEAEILDAMAKALGE
jgi:selenoprotein W-related protein